MFAIYLSSGVDSSDRGYLKGFRVHNKTISGKSYSYKEPILVLSENGFRIYKRYSSAERYCGKLPEILKIYCTNGLRYGWAYRCLYDIFVVDLDTAKSWKMSCSDLHSKH